MLALACAPPSPDALLGDQPSKDSPRQALPFLRLGQIRNGQYLGPFLVGWLTLFPAACR